MKIFYYFFITAYPFLVRLASVFNGKAKLWINGRKDIFEKMQQIISPDQPLIWMHCSSLGEFEQGRPLIEEIKKNYPSYKILLTFFSPSGYEVRKDYKGADYIFYLPMDSKKNATQFFKIAKPSLILFIKYEFWYYYLNEAKKKNVPLLLISGVFRKTDSFFSKYGGFYRSLLSYFFHLFIQNEESLFLLKSIGFDKNVTISGDTRFDRVVEIAEQFSPVSFAEEFCKNSDIIVAGSTWSEDDVRLAAYKNTTNLKYIIAPHNVSQQRLEECLKLYKKAVLFSTLKNLPPASDINTIIIDNIGMLSNLYKYATISFVGGGFGKKGVHNVLEAAVYGKPVVFGPIYEKYTEVIELVKTGGGMVADDAAGLQSIFDRLLKKDQNYEKASEASSNYVYSRKGATHTVLQFIYEKRLLTK